MKGFLVGVVVTILAIVAIVYIYFATGMAPVATSASPIPFEGKFAHMALHARMEKEMPTQVPVPADETNLTAGGTRLHGAVRGLPWSSRKRPDGNCQRRIPASPCILFQR